MYDYPIYKPGADEPLIGVAALQRRIAAHMGAGAAFDSPDVAALRDRVDAHYGAYRE